MDSLLHLEDLPVGTAMPLGSTSVSKEEIFAFARAYDPQPHHLDEEAAKTSITKGLCASGFHSCCLMMRLLYEGLLKNSTSLGSPGIDEVRWLKPLRPDQKLAARYLCSEKRALASKPGVGLAKIRFEMMEPSGDVIMIWQSNQLLRVRHPAPPSDRPATAPAAPRSKAPGGPLIPPPPAGEPARRSNYLEDLSIGEIIDLAPHTFTREEIVAFARAFDPQPFHLDEEAATKSLFGGLCASGWQTAAIFIRQLVSQRHGLEAQMRSRGERPAVWGPSPGFKNLQWLKPVFVGDTIAFRSRTVGKVDLRSRPDRGLVQTENEGVNQKGEPVFRILTQILVERREHFVPNG